ncbi:NarK family nitrate/nitrite MFS transporter [Spartinivicinus poritis]|uniref:Nitrate/nitrite transporter n=1 Tax=Spartinivicinus poritis TaxID=2994640 RepID=A0ABT5UHY4_9GAMM|nr:NarK family nitrate/nitrite MFS transporter [Spartinivicinus sp. A2-2]MDE1465997.1 NarK family nitrate/nitrite MFS transporter [Spartinivicinus sp. A2-2]
MSYTDRFQLFSFTGKMKVLHLSWVAFFITFIVWFNHAPLLMAIADSLNISISEIKTLLIINVALTIPARIIIGMLTDRYGPRLVYSSLLVLCSLPCFAFAIADSFTQAAIARFFLGFIGAGFVIGIRLISEWFPHNELGIAEGVYGGWGNFGSAAAALTLPTLALLFGGEDGWRYAVGLTGLLSLGFGIIFYQQVTDTPKGSTYFKPKHLGAIEVTSKGDLFLLMLMKLPLYGALILLVWKLSPEAANILSVALSMSLYVCLAVLCFIDCYKAWQVNKTIFSKPVPKLHQYKFKQVTILNILYFATFGSELAVISMLPLFFAETFQLNPVTAGLLASAYAFMNVMSRPGGGWLSDRFGRKPVLLILTAGLAIGYFVMGMVDSEWPLWLAVVAAMTCSFFVQSGEGAVFAVVPLIKRRLTGQIAGMTGAYGNIGAVTYLTILSFVDYSNFFMVIAGTALVGFIILLWMDEPAGQIAEINEDGTVELINVA